MVFGLVRGGIRRVVEGCPTARGLEIGLRPARSTFWTPRLLGVWDGIFFAPGWYVSFL